MDGKKELEDWKMNSQCSMVSKTHALDVYLASNSTAHTDEQLQAEMERLQEFIEAQCGYVQFSPYDWVVETFLAIDTSDFSASDHEKFNRVAAIWRIKELACYIADFCVDPLPVSAEFVSMYESFGFKLNVSV